MIKKPCFNLKILIPVFIILLITFISFLPCLKNEFTNWDDDQYITKNQVIRSLSFENIKQMFSPLSQHDLYTPLTYLSYSIEYHFFNLNPFYYHLTNLILHMLDSLLVFWLIYLLSNKVSVSLITALLFGIHPLHVESVAWATERKDVLYSFFFLSSIISYVYYQKHKSFVIPVPCLTRDKLQHGIHIFFYYLSLFLFILSLFSKPMAVTLPLILLVCDYLLNRKFDSKIIKEKIIFFLLSFVFILIAILDAYNTNLIKQVPAMPFVYYIFSSFYGLMFYLIKILIPMNLSCFYPFPENISNNLPFSFLISPAIIIILIAIAVFSKKHTRKITFGFLFFFIAILPVSQILPANKSLVYDRYTYIPSIGLFYLAGEGFYWLYLKYNKTIKTMLLVTLTIIIGVLSFSTYQRCHIWKNSITLWENVLENYPNAAIAHHNLGYVYNEKGDYDKALPYYDQALKLNPSYAEAYNNRGILYAKKENFDMAIDDFNNAILLRPHDGEIYSNRAAAYLRKGRFDKVLEDVKKSQELGYQINPEFLGLVFTLEMLQQMKK